MIEPTVGRVVWFRASANDTIKLDSKQPLAAMITYVHGPRIVNLVVYDPNGVPHSRTSVTLLQSEDEVPAVMALGSFCEWMPYQIGQAKKNA